MTLTDLHDAEVCDLSVQDLALVVLDQLNSTNEWNLHNFRNSEVVRGRSEQAQRCLYEAQNWLLSNGLIALGKPGQSSADAMIITRLGQRALAEGLGRVRAGTRLNVDLHSSLAVTRGQFLGGDFELAAFAAMRSVEIRVRELARADKSLVGVALMRQAFSPEHGPLADHELESGERQGVMDLFAGAMGMFKNPPSHRQVDYSDATEASEVILLADLLHRHLDRVERRLESEAAAQ
jgi:uncharacterized protein (TIGR02391 family)